MLEDIKNGGFVKASLGLEKKRERLKDRPCGDKSSCPVVSFLQSVVHTVWRYNYLQLICGVIKLRQKRKDGISIVLSAHLFLHLQKSSQHGLF